MVSNRSYETQGTDDPNRRWIDQLIRVKTHPEWGQGRVLRWYPASADQPQRVRVFCDGLPVPKGVLVDEIEIAP